MKIKIKIIALRTKLNYKNTLAKILVNFDYFYVHYDMIKLAESQNGIKKSWKI